MAGLPEGLSWTAALPPTMVTEELTPEISPAMRSTKLRPLSVSPDLSVPMRRDSPPTRMKPAIESMEEVYLTLSLAAQASYLLSLKCHVARIVRFSLI